MTQYKPSSVARAFRALAAIEEVELPAVILSMLCFFFLFGSYSVVKPVRDAMGTVYGVKHLQELFTATFIASLVLAPMYAGLAARIRLATFLPWVYGFIAASVLLFCGLFSSVSDPAQLHWVAAAFYVWVSTFNILIISVFWSFMADMFSRTQAKRLFGFIAAGGTAGGIVGPLIATLLGKSLGNGGLLIISAAGFVVTAVVLRMLGSAKVKLVATDSEAQQTTLDHKLSGGLFDGFRLLFRSPYLMLLALFLLLMTWVSTIVYFQLGDLITKAFASADERTRAYAVIELAVNSLAVLFQLFGTGRLIRRFGVTTGLLVNPLIMVVAFVAVLFSPVLLLLGGIQIVRRAAEYAVAKPTREMLFTVVDQESRYKAKNVIDTVVYRFGDLSASWVSHAVLPFGVAGLAIFGGVVSVIWFPIALQLGRRYERARGIVY